MIHILDTVTRCRNTLDDTMVSVSQGDGGDDKAYLEDDAVQL